MYRTAIEHLHKWKNKKNKKPLIIRGARQVGKTWLMKDNERIWKYRLYRYSLH